MIWFVLVFTWTLCFVCGYGTGAKGVYNEAEKNRAGWWVQKNGKLIFEWRDV